MTRFVADNGIYAAKITNGPSIASGDLIAHAMIGAADDATPTFGAGSSAANLTTLGTAGGEGPWPSKRP